MYVTHPTFQASTPEAIVGRQLSALTLHLCWMAPSVALTPSVSRLSIAFVSLRCQTGKMSRGDGGGVAIAEGYLDDLQLVCTACVCIFCLTVPEVLESNKNESLSGMTMSIPSTPQKRHKLSY